jgi:hypothetical protein
LEQIPKVVKVCDQVWCFAQNLGEFENSAWCALENFSRPEATESCQVLELGTAEFRPRHPILNFLCLMTIPCSIILIITFIALVVQDSYMEKKSVSEHGFTIYLNETGPPNDPFYDFQPESNVFVCPASTGMSVINTPRGRIVPRCFSRFNSSLCYSYLSLEGIPPCVTCIACLPVMVELDLVARQEAEVAGRERFNALQAAANARFIGFITAACVLVVYLFKFSGMVHCFRGDLVMVDGDKGIAEVTFKLDKPLIAQRNVQLETPALWEAIERQLREKALFTEQEMVRWHQINIDYLGDLFR